MSGPVASNSLLMNLGMRYPTQVVASAVIALGVVTTPLQTVENTDQLPMLVKIIAG